MDRLLMLTILALRTMVSHRVKNAIVGSIMVFGTLLVVVGTSLLDSIQRSMQESITSSVTGHIQVFDKDAKDELAIFGGMNAAQEIGEINDFEKLQTQLLEIPQIEAVVPMAIGSAVSFGKGELDRVLFDLREAARDSNTEALSQKKAHVQQIARLMLQENTNQAEISTDPAQIAEEREVILSVLKEDFWEGFVNDPTEQLEALDTQLAPLSTEGRLIYINYIATDPDHFKEAFDRFQIVDGQMIPSGTRGMLFSKYYYEKAIKNRVAREFDAIKKDVDKGAVIATDEVLKNRIDRMSKIASSVVFQLDAQEAPVVANMLRELLGNPDGNIDDLMGDYLRVNDQTIQKHYAYFYEKSRRLSTYTTSRLATRLCFSPSRKVVTQSPSKLRFLEHSTSVASKRQTSLAPRTSWISSLSGHFTER